MIMITCDRCGKQFIPYKDGFSAGFGEDDAGHKYCYPCCAELDKEQMARDGKTALYLSLPYEGKNNDKYEVINWPGTLRFDARVKIVKSRRAIWNERIDVWFYDHESNLWYGRLQSRDSNVINVRRLKRRLENINRS